MDLGEKEEEHPEEGLTLIKGIGAVYLEGAGYLCG